MKFRPCIDIHNGAVKQIVGGSLRNDGDYADENFVSAHDSAWFARLFKKDGIKGAHVVLLNGKDSKFYHESRKEALNALAAYPGGLQVGGGVNAVNARSYIEAGASH
ncbi:MAG: phosphoribosylformimino-5-aminoimidazole carboxamide ribotide isomerase, partial [Lachnospiraceae bacterium]|nr:phosphoribosylformimino-5-aminoimidazole carboxamide ribotide isomerase [Lachnospiraceae bacterium]